MPPSSKPKIHFVGLCGKVTGPLALELVRLGYRVTGSDDRPLPPIADLLAQGGLLCHPAFSPDNLPPDADLVLANAFYGPENPELVRAKELGIPVSSFACFLGENFLLNSCNAVVAGSYGKTTTASVLAWILEFAGLSPSWLVGGDCPNLGKQVRLGTGKQWVLEGDEYRSGPNDPRPKFSYYHPECVIITALDHVHQDQFESFREAVSLYDDLISSAPSSHPVLVADQPEIRHHLGHWVRQGRMKTVGFNASADIRLGPSRWDGARNKFNLQSVEFELRLRGDFACVNAALAALTAVSLGVDLSTSAEALAEYQGVRARQEVVADDPRLTVVYDMGIYPKSLGKVVEAVRASAAGRRLCVLFQPRYTLGCEEDYYSSLASAFSSTDCLLVTESPVPQEGIDGWFAFDPENLRSRLSCSVVEVGPTLECYPRWENEVREGDVWLILTEHMFPEPLHSIREFCRRRGFQPSSDAAV